jgi:hypothetical protein
MKSIDQVYFPTTIPRFRQVKHYRRVRAGAAPRRREWRTGQAALPSLLRSAKEAVRNPGGVR